MGWTTCYNATHYKKDGSVDRRMECDDLLTYEVKDANGVVTKRSHVVKSAMVGKVYYAAVQFDRTDGTPPEVWAAVFDTCGKWKDGTIWGYKDMDETVGPYFYDCPESILNLLTPTKYETAQAWRDKCREHLAQKKLPQIEIAGVNIYYKGGWVCTSDEYRRKNYFQGVRYGRFFKRDTALFQFLKDYGTPEQKEEYKSKTGKEVA
jgi:hypothetical protein